MKNDNAIGIDLVKNVLQIHITDSKGKKIGAKQLKCNQLLTFFANLSLSLIAIAAIDSVVIIQ